MDINYRASLTVLRCFETAEVQPINTLFTKLDEQNSKILRLHIKAEVSTHEYLPHQVDFKPLLGVGVITQLQLVELVFVDTIVFKEVWPTWEASLDVEVPTIGAVLPPNWTMVKTKTKETL